MHGLGDSAAALLASSVKAVFLLSIVLAGPQAAGSCVTAVTSFVGAKTGTQKLINKSNFKQHRTHLETWGRNQPYNPATLKKMLQQATLPLFVSRVLSCGKRAIEK